MFNIYFIVPSGASNGRFPTTAFGKELSAIGSSAWDTLGTQGLRPFELATLRLQNMMGGILDNWQELSPVNQNLVIQQGGSIVFKNKDVVYRYNDKGILTYTPVDEIIDLLSTLSTNNKVRK